MTHEDIGEQIIVEQMAKEMPEMTTVKLRMTNLRLYSTGVFSNVYRGTLLDPGPVREIAIKKTWPEVLDKNFELIFLTGISRERHKNIVQMLYVFSNKNNKDGKICESYVFDFMPSTLASLIKSESIDLIDTKLYTFQLFHGLRYLAANLIAHRDIKPVNLLVDPKIGLLRIGDFGSAKIIRKNMQSTAYQVTRFYRPPELLMGATNYNHCVDLWSGGCVLGEMLRGSVLFPGRDTRHQMKLIFTALGSPSEGEMRSMHAQVRLDGQMVQPAGLGQLMPDAHRDALEVVQRILVYNPKARLGGRDLLLDPWFDSLFVEGARRSNNQLISEVIQLGDISEIRGTKQSKHTKSTLINCKKAGEETNESMRLTNLNECEMQCQSKIIKPPTVTYAPQTTLAPPTVQGAPVVQDSKKRKAVNQQASSHKSALLCRLRKSGSDRSKLRNVNPLRKKKSNENESRVTGGADALPNTANK